MSDLQLILFDDAAARNWFPFTQTRPAGELLFGCFTLRRRAELAFAAPALGHLTDDALRGFDEPDGAPVLEQVPNDTTRPRLFLSSRVVPEWNAALPEHATALRVNGAPAGFYCPPGTPSPDRAALTGLHSGDTFALPGIMLEHIWDLVAHNAEQVGADITNTRSGRWAELPHGVFALGEPRLALGLGVSIEPGVVLDFRAGPILLDDQVEVRAFTRLQGPAYIGRHTTVLGGPLCAVSIGPHCKVHGELEETVVLGYSNKAHDGFIGHAYLGSWVNLGALTTNSDLKNNYGSIRLWTPQGEVDTSAMKLGCFFGDHVKTAIGSMINTGTVVGAGSNIFGGMPPRFVPPFSWGSDLAEYAFDKFIATAEVVMKRRKVALGNTQRELLRVAHANSGTFNRAADRA